MSFQGFDVETYVLPGGRIKSYRRIKVSPGRLWEIKNGVKVYMQGQVKGEIEGKGKLLFSLLRPLAIAGGSWQRIKPVPGMAVYLPDDDGGEPMHIGMENISIHIPEDFEFNRLEGSEDNFTFPFDVMGQTYIAAVPVLDHMNESGF